MSLPLRPTQYSSSFPNFAPPLLPSLSPLSLLLPLCLSLSLSFLIDVSKPQESFFFILFFIQWWTVSYFLSFSYFVHFVILSLGSFVFVPRPILTFSHISFIIPFRILSPVYSPDKLLYRDKGTKFEDWSVVS